MHPLLGIGLETGTAYMRDRLVSGFHAHPLDAGSIVGGYTDGITRNRGYYLGPTARLGSSLYLVGSLDIVELADGRGHAYDSRWGGSAGLGLSGRARIEPHAELRIRWARAGERVADAVQFAFGFDFR